MTNINELLSMVENPTRRRILEALTREPHYPLQLSKELGVSQPAIVKHLNLLEEHGMVTKYQQESRVGPKRTLYVPNSEFTLVMDMRNGMFSAKAIFPPESKEEPKREEIRELEEVRSTISDIDTEIDELERMRCGMVRRRESLIRSMLDSMPMDMGYLHRSMLYGMLNEPEKDLKGISEDMSIDADRAENIMEDIRQICKDFREDR